MVKLKLPAVIRVSDYHEFGYFESKLNQLTDKKVKVVEIGFNAPNYIGLVYTGIKPGKKTVNELLAAANIQLENED